MHAVYCVSVGIAVLHVVIDYRSRPSLDHEHRLQFEYQGSIHRGGGGGGGGGQGGSFPPKTPSFSPKEE